MKLRIHTFTLSSILMLFVLGLSTPVLAEDKGGAGVKPIPQMDCIIEPSEIVDVGSAVPGVVERIEHYRNDLIKSGEVLARLESSVEQATLELSRERARLNTAIELRQESARFGHLTQKRSRTLLKTAAISEHELDSVNSETRIAELQVRQELDNKRLAGLELLRAKAVVERRTIRSPVNGVVMDRFKSVGEYIDDEPLLRLAQLHPLHVEVIVPVDFLGRIKPGMQADVLPAIPDAQHYVATVERVDRVSDAASGTYGVRLRLDNPDYHIPSGLRCQVGFIAVKEKSEAVVAVQNSQELDSAVGVTENALREQARIDDVVEQESAVLQAVVPETADSTPAVEISRCLSLGPFNDEVETRNWRSRLKQHTFESKLRSEKRAVTKDYMVLSTVQDDVKKVLNRLNESGFKDHFLIRKGVRRGRISLGVYNSPRSAKSHQRSLASKGFTTEIVHRTREQIDYWLDIPMSADSRLPKRFAQLPVAATLDPTRCSAMIVNR